MGETVEHEMLLAVYGQYGIHKVQEEIYDNKNENLCTLPKYY